MVDWSCTSDDLLCTLVCGLLGSDDDKIDDQKYTSYRVNHSKSDSQTMSCSISNFNMALLLELVSYLFQSSFAAFVKVAEWLISGCTLGEDPRESHSCFKRLLDGCTRGENPGEFLSGICDYVLSVLSADPLPTAFQFVNLTNTFQGHRESLQIRNVNKEMVKEEKEE